MVGRPGSAFVRTSLHVSLLRCIRKAAIAAILGLALCGCAAPDVVELASPCTTFVVADPGRPLPLRETPEGFELTLFLTPKEFDEGSRVYRSVKRHGSIRMIVHPTMESIRVLREHNGEFYVHVASQDDALRVARMFCYRDK